MATDPERITELLTWNVAIAERVILSALCHNEPDMRRYILDRLAPDNFFTSFDREVFEAMQSQIADRGGVDIEQIRQDFKAPYLDQPKEHENWLFHIDATIDHIKAIQPTMAQVERAVALMFEHRELRRNWSRRSRTSDK